MLWAYAFKIGRKVGQGKWKPVKEARLIKKGIRKGVFELTFFNGEKGLARSIREKGEGSQISFINK